MWGPRWIAKLVYNSNNYGLWYANNYSIHGVYKPTNITGGLHIVSDPPRTSELVEVDAQELERWNDDVFGEGAGWCFGPVRRLLNVIKPKTVGRCL